MGGSVLFWKVESISNNLHLSKGGELVHVRELFLLWNSLNVGVERKQFSEYWLKPFKNNTKLFFFSAF